MGKLQAMLVRSLRDIFGIMFSALAGQLSRLYTNLVPGVGAFGWMLALGSMHSACRQEQKFTLSGGVTRKVEKGGCRRPAEGWFWLASLGLFRWVLAWLVWVEE